MLQSGWKVVVQAMPTLNALCTWTRHSTPPLSTPAAGKQISTGQWTAIPLHPTQEEVDVKLFLPPSCHAN